MRISQEGTFFTNAFCTTSSLELGIDSLLHGIHFQPNTLTGELVKDIPSLQSIFKKRATELHFLVYGLKKYRLKILNIGRFRLRKVCPIIPNSFLLMEVVR